MREGAPSRGRTEIAKPGAELRVLHAAQRFSTASLRVRRGAGIALYEEHIRRDDSAGTAEGGLVSQSNAR